MKSLSLKEQKLAIDMLRYITAVYFGREKPFTEGEMIKQLKKKIK